MKKVKKLFAALLAVTLVLGIMPMTVFAATTVDSGEFFGNFKWSLNSDGVLTVSGKGAMGDFDEDIPPWFEYYEDITSIVINEGITKIGNYAFALLYNATKLSIPSSVTEIGAYSFAYCESVANVTFPSGLKTIGESAFQGCVSLEAVNVPAGLEIIGFCAFTECYSLSDFTVNPINPYYSVGGQDVLFNKDKTALLIAPASLEGSYTVPDTVEVIDSFAFTNSISVEAINIPASVEAIGLAAFLGAVSLETINVSEANAMFSSDASGVLFDKEKSGIIVAPHGMTGTYTIPDSVEIIESYAFAMTEGLTEVIISESVTMIGNYSFVSSGITTMTVPASVTYIANAAFAGCLALENIYFEGDAPEIEIEVPVFDETTTKAYYPEGNGTWTSAVRKSFGSDIEWIAYTPVTTLPGDVDGSGDITNTDLIIMARYIVGLENSADIEKYGDIDGDGKVTNTDLVAAARIVVGLD